MFSVWIQLCCLTVICSEYVCRGAVIGTSTRRHQGRCCVLLTLEGDWLQNQHSPMVELDWLFQPWCFVPEMWGAYEPCKSANVKPCALVNLCRLSCSTRNRRDILGLFLLYQFVGLMTILTGREEFCKLILTWQYCNRWLFLMLSQRLSPANLGWISWLCH